MEGTREDELDTGSDARVAGVHTKRHQLALSKVTRELSSEELTESGTVKMLVESLYRLEAEVNELKEYRERYHEADTRAASLQERLSALREGKATQDVVSGVMFGIGGAMFGAGTSFDGYPQWMALLFGVVLIIGGVVAKVPRLWLGREGG